MAKFIDGVKHGLGLIVVVVLFLGLVYLGKAAWTGDDGLTVSGTETLTTAKWNDLVARTYWETVDPSNTDDFDPNCIRMHNGTYNTNGTSRTWIVDQVGAPQITTHWSNVYLLIYPSNKGVYASESQGSTWTLNWIKRKCM